MAGVNAYPDAAFIFHMIDDMTDMLKFIAQVASLAGSVFDDGRYAFGPVQGDIDRY